MPLSVIIDSSDGDKYSRKPTNLPSSSGPSSRARAVSAWLCLFWSWIESVLSVVWEAMPVPNAIGWSGVSHKSCCPVCYILLPLSLAVQGARVRIFRSRNVDRAGCPWHVISANPKHVVGYGKVYLRCVSTGRSHETKIKSEIVTPLFHPLINTIRSLIAT